VVEVVVGQQAVLVIFYIDEGIFDFLDNYILRQVCRGLINSFALD